MELDIRGEMSEDAMDKMDRFIESAYLSGMPFVRIIHGKGTGKLRQVVREALRGHPHVSSFEEGGEKEGGETGDEAIPRQHQDDVAHDLAVVEVHPQRLVGRDGQDVALRVFEADGPAHGVFFDFHVLAGRAPFLR